MKVIGKIGDENYIVEISLREIADVFDKAVYSYGNVEGFPKPKIGEVINLSAGHDFRDEIKSLCREMHNADKQFMRARDTLMKFSTMVAQMPDVEPQTQETK